MKKIQPYGKTLKDQYRASARDRLFRFLMADGTVKGAILHGTRMVNEMRANHELGILETLVLGRVYLGAGLMSAALKGGDRLSIKIDCSGPVKGLAVETNAFGEVRGYLKHVPIPVDKPMTDFDLSPFFGAGMLSVTRHLENAKHPFTGQVILKYGNVAKDLAYYYLTSEQIPTAFHLSIKFDRKGYVSGAGGLLLQALPGVDEDRVETLEAAMVDMPSPGEVFTTGRDPKNLVEETFGAFAPRFLDEKRIEFMCHCNKNRLENVLTLLPIDDLKDICDNGPFPLEMRCHYCNTVHSFGRDEIAAIYGRRYPDN
jgi:molecular chaperone Hsp33